MNVQVNPALHPTQQPYGYSNPRGPSPFTGMSQYPPNNQPSHSPFPPGQFPPNLQNHNPLQQQQVPQFYQQFQQQNAAFGRPQNQGVHDLAHAPQTTQSQAPYNQFEHPSSHLAPVSQAPTSSPVPTSSQQTNNMAAPAAPMTPNNMIPRSQSMQNMQTPGLAQQAQLQNAAQMQRGSQQQLATSMSPQSAQRERARVTVLLEINSCLLQEVVSLQAQGKAGSAPAQPSPTSPTSATDPSNTLNNSPVDPSKQGLTKPPTQEYADCMRRLQANLSYLAAIADAKKKANGSLPLGPAIMIPPPHLPTVHELYKKLNALFPEASQTTINKAMAVASAQASRGPAPLQTQG